MGNNASSHHKHVPQPPVPAVASARAYEGPFATVEMLTKDVFFVISGFLEARDVFACAQVCRHFAHLLRHEPVWQRLLLRDSPQWAPYVPPVALEKGPGACGTWRELYRRCARQARLRRVTFSQTVGGNVRLEEEGRHAVHFSSYGTSKSEQAFGEGVHYCQALIEYKSHYCGVGIIRDSVGLPDAGTGAWLSTGAIQWVTGSGLWGYTNHQANCNDAYRTGDEVGVLLDLRVQPGRVYWYLNGRLVGQLDLQPTDERYAFCFCVGDGGARITRTSLPDELPPGFAPVHE